MPIKLKKLSELTHQEPIIEISGFVLRPFDQVHFFLENEAGEGTTITKQEFVEVLNYLFYRNF